MLKRMSHLNQRLCVGISVLCLILIAIYFSSYPYFRPAFALITAMIIGGAVWEFYQMAKNKGVHPLEGVGVLGSIVYVVAVFWSTQSAAALLLPMSVFGLLLLLGFLHFFFLAGRPLLDLSVTFFGLLYLSVPLGFLVSINYYFPSGSLPDGRWWLIFLILATKMTDTGGFFFGKMFGRKKMTPHISPKKTWEGCIGGGGAAVVAIIAYYLVSERLWPAKVEGLSLLLAVGLGAVLSVLAQIGDLSESILKRDAGAKDSNQLPGLGGVLDIVDSLVFTTPTVYLFLRLMYN